MPSRLVPVLTIASLLALAWLAPTAGARPGAEGYIVVLKDRVDAPGEVANDHERRYGASVEFVYRQALSGYAGTIPASRVDDVRSENRVDYVERDGRVHATRRNTVQATPQALPWGIDQIDADTSSTLAGNGSGGVSNVNAYVIDTGIDRGHADLNVVNHVNFAGGKDQDCNGHGTHVAGTVAARDNTTDVVGAAPGARLTGVKVLGCSGSGTTSGVIKGIDWVTGNAARPAIANMSLGGSASTALDDAVKRSANSGVFYSVAAGNEGVDACSRSPARAGTAAGVVTTGATDKSDHDPSWSNFGSCVDIHAPGVSILSTKRGGGTATMSGTSMAAPHVGGAGALYLSSHTGASPATVESAIKSAAVSTGTTSNNGSSIELLNVGGF